VNEGGLDFGSAEAVASVAVHSTQLSTVWVLLSIALLFALAALSVWGSLRSSRGRVWMQLPALSSFPPALKLAVVLTLGVLLLVQAFAASGVVVHTRIVHGSTEEYFQYLSLPRLIGISHAHLFGYAILYGLIALFAALAEVGDGLKASVVALMVWAGLFDVLSWWGIKYVSPRFEWLSITAAVTTTLASLVTFFVVVRSLPAKVGIES
jgi:hypothetical protein